MATLSNPTFQVDILTGSPNVTVTGTVNVVLDQFETFLINAGLPLRLESELWGNDGGLNGADDYLFTLPSQNITKAGTYTFSATIPKGILNEDNSWFDQRDEVYNKFRMVSGSNVFPVNVVAKSPDIHGYF
jgi:hypothetical protein